MVLSTNGDHPMTKLSDTQAVILSAASQRDDGAVLPLPETLKISGGAVDKVLRSLKTKGLIDHRGTRRGDDPPPLRVTRAGLEAIGVEPEDEGESADAPAPATKADGATPAKKNKPGKGKATAVDSVAVVALMEQLVAGQVLQPLARECQQFQFRRFQPGE